jgi:hypothetical protein
MRFAIAFVGLFLGLALAGTAHAEKQPSDDRQKADDLMKSARQTHRMSILAVQVGAGMMALGLLYAAFDGVRKASRKAAATGAGTGGAWAMAVVLILIAAGLAGAALFYIPTFGPQP